MEFVALQEPFSSREKVCPNNIYPLQEKVVLSKWSVPNETHPNESRPYPSKSRLVRKSPYLKVILCV